MIPINLQGLLPLPPDGFEATTGLPPWPEGSILAGQLEPTSNPQQALLSIGRHRMLANTPPDMPAQSLWLQLVDRHPPARFRLLSVQQAEQAIAHMLQKHAGEPEVQRQAQAAPTPHAEQPAPLHHPDSPYDFVPVSPAPPRWLIVDHHDEDTPRGMLKAESTAQGFQLRGRLDLPQLGPVSFVIANAPNGIRLSLYAAEAEGYRTLQQDFPGWLAGRMGSLDASLHAGTMDDEAIAGSRLA